MMSKQAQEKDTEEELRETFGAMDKDGNGFITGIELTLSLKGRRGCLV